MRSRSDTPTRCSYPYSIQIGSIGVNVTDPLYFIQKYQKPLCPPVKTKGTVSILL